MVAGLFLLDTDSLSLYERGYAEVTRRILLADRDAIAISVVTVEEQMTGRLASLRTARTLAERERAYFLLSETAQALGRLRILPFTVTAMERYESLVASKLNIGKYDLKIAAIALENGAVLVTRNRRDFERVPGLVCENWAD